jgi:hypothetical protein
MCACRSAFAGAGSTQRRHHAVRPDRSFRPPQAVGIPTGGVSPLCSRHGTVGILLLHPGLPHPASCLPSLSAVLLPAPSAASGRFGTMKALTPGNLTRATRSLRLPRLAVPTFRPQPRDPPTGRFVRRPPPSQGQASAPVVVPGFARHEQARHEIPPKQVRPPTDCRFTSSCSPPRLAATQ